MATSKTKILDYRATEPRRRFRPGMATRIPQSPNRLSLATVHVRIRNRDIDDNKVELIATVGVQGVTGIAQLLFKIFRDGRQIFTTQQGVESAGSEKNYVVTFQAIDSRVPTGTHTYTLTVENRTAGAAANVVGPVSFSALAIQRNESRGTM